MDEANTRPYHMPSDAVWFITGCSSGLGLALAQHITTTSSRVVATARNPSSLSAIPDGPNVLKLALDVTSIPSIHAALNAAVERFGRVDVVVNNAGYALVGDTEAAGDAESRALLDTNFWGMVDVSKRALGIMRETNQNPRGGVILNISSMGGWMGYPGSAFYHASKFATEGWTEAVAKELPVEWNIHLCNVEPGGFKTKFTSSSLNYMTKRHPAYADPSFPGNMVIAYMEDPKSREDWAEPEAAAAAMYKLVSRGQRIPIRVPLGADSWNAVMADLKKCEKDFEELGEFSSNLK
ncbi:hypothetical protein G7054_g6229 [Neopestalotiopsis clavispora]|nr:hypothetical protein G7054_g6229 [Neopestalotiopsis clavispora]